MANIDTIVKNMSKDIEGMKIENHLSNYGIYSIENSIAHIDLNNQLGSYNIDIKDPVSLGINEEDLYEESYEEITPKKWWIKVLIHICGCTPDEPKTINGKFVRPILNKEDIEEIHLRLTEVYNEYEYNRLTSIMNKLNIDISDLNYLKRYFIDDKKENEQL